MRVVIIFLIISVICGQPKYNHPELDWYSFETEHFKIHYHDDAESSAREAATVAEHIYDNVTSFYDYEPKEKTHIVLKDTDDYSNGAAYYYDNKIVIWASPLNFELRGSHRWLQNVITHEFVHIISLQKSMKMGTKIPGAYFQYMGYEEEKRKDVLYGYPNMLVSYPIPGTSVPPWLAEGIAQYMYDEANWDTWDTHRDMILRDRTINNNLLSFDQISTFGKKGIGNESTYNTGYALSRYISYKYGSIALKNIITELSNPLQYSVNDAIYNVLDIDGYRLYDDFKSTLKERYKKLTNLVELNLVKPKIIIDKGTSNLFPIWSNNSDKFLYLSNQNNDFFGQTDLFLYDIEDSSETKISSSVYSAPSWNANDKIIYYSKKPKFPDKNGSKYYDIYEYDLNSKKEKRITNKSRAFSPVFISSDSSIAYLSTKDGSQDIYQIKLKSNEIIQLTSFKDRPMLSSLVYNEHDNSLYFDITTNHYRDIASISLSDSVFKMVLNNGQWDERNTTITSNGSIIYSDDRSGIYNLFYIDTLNQEQGYITNVLGGAFMPNINKKGKILCSVYSEGGYKIGLLDNFNFIDESSVGYSNSNFLKNKNNLEPINSLDTAIASSYIDQFPEMFIMPKVMYDYGTIKPGLYFYSNEIIDRLNLFGGASSNNLFDLDLFFIFEFHRLYPTLFFETFYQTRNTSDRTKYQDIYEIDSDIKFRMVMFRSGLRVPLYGSTLEIYGSWQRYRAFIEESLPSERIEAGSAYDYYRGLAISADWKLDIIKPRLDGSINPSNGMSFFTRIDFEKNKFIQGLDLSNAGTLVEDFVDNDLLRIQSELSYHYELPWFDRWTTSIKVKGGFISNTEVDSFFHFFNGGLIGLKGYPFYSIEGTRSALIDLCFRVPIIREKNIKLGWFIMQNSVLGAIFQFGDAWRNKNDLSWKKSVGVQWRINGFSFYNFPTAIELELHQGLNNFTRIIKGEIYSYGKEQRSYLRVLFDF